MPVPAVVRHIDENDNEIAYGPFDSVEHAEDWVCDLQRQGIAGTVVIMELAHPEMLVKRSRDKFAWREGDLVKIGEMKDGIEVEA